MAEGSQRMNVAVLGTGTMGTAMARNLIAAGHSVTVYNRNREKARPAIDAGATFSATPREAVASAADAALAMVADDNESRAVWLGADGAIAGAKPGALLLECSTVSPRWAWELAGQAKAKGASLLDAPVSGSKPQAEGRQLVFLAGGEPDAFARAKPIFDALGKAAFHMGATGTGAVMKLVTNLLLGVQVASLAEGLALAERAGLDLQAVADALAAGSTGSPIVKVAASRILARDLTTNFATYLIEKDLGYVLAEAAAHGLTLPTTAAARDEYARAAAAGFAQKDFTAVAETLRK